MSAPVRTSRRAACLSMEAFQKLPIAHAAAKLVVDAAARRLLTRWAVSRTAPVRVVLRSRIVLHLAESVPVSTIARSLGTTAVTVRLWRRRFIEGGAAALLHDAPGRGRKPGAAPVDPRLHEYDGLTVREAARVLGVSPSTVSRWRRRSASESSDR